MLWWAIRWEDLDCSFAVIFDQQQSITSRKAREFLPGGWRTILCKQKSWWEFEPKYRFWIHTWEAISGRVWNGLLMIKNNCETVKPNGNFMKEKYALEKEAAEVYLIKSENKPTVTQQAKSRLCLVERWRRQHTSYPQWHLLGHRNKYQEPLMITCLFKV